jgi:hypothetical protein
LCIKCKAEPLVINTRDAYARGRGGVPLVATLEVDTLLTPPESSMVIMYTSGDIAGRTPQRARLPYAPPTLKRSIKIKENQNRFRRGKNAENAYTTMVLLLPELKRAGDAA